MNSQEIRPIPHVGNVARCSRLMAALTLAAGILVTLGWQFRIPLLRADFMGTFVAPNTALLLILFGLSLLLQVRPGVLTRSLGLALGLAALAIATTILAEHVTRKYLYVDRLYMAHRLSDWYVAFPVGRIALPTSIAFVFAGVGLMAAVRRSLGWLSDTCGTVVIAIAYLSLIGYTYGISRFYGKVMALPTTLLLIPVGMGLLTARSEGGVVETITGREAGSIVLRRVLPALVILLPVLGLIRSRSEAMGLSDEMATALFVLAAVASFAVIIFHTATILNRVDAARKKEHEELQDFIENAVVGLHWVGPDGTILWANAAELNLLGYTAQEYIGRNIKNFHADEDVICDILERLSCRQKLEGYPARLKCKDGSIKHVIIHSSVLFERNEFVHTRCFTFDVSAEREAQQKLQLQEKALRNSEKLAVTGRMAAALAHEINNPLEAVTNLLYLTRGDSGMSEQSRKFLQLADQELARVAHVSRHTLAFYRGTTREVEFSLEEMCDQLLIIMTSRIAAKGLSVARTYENGSKAVAIDSEARQVISNLILNAIDAAPADSTITLIVDDRKPGSVRFAIEDRGQGVSDETFGRIFEPFFTTKETGTGLGLWVSQDILKRNGGSLVLESRRHPTRFSAYFKSSTMSKTISA
jgi:PAS domain S-box-containing protein